MCTIMCLALLGVAGPSGPLSDCPCCAGANPQRPLRSISIDFCFSLVHLARCGSSSIELVPPNLRLYLLGQQVAALLGSPVSAAAEAEAERACSDFNAAKAMARTSDKVHVIPVLHAHHLLPSRH